MSEKKFIPFFVLGFISLSFQIFLLREMMVVFSGNEVSLGIILSLWMIGVFCGSVLGVNFKKFTSLAIFLGILLPLDLIAVRILKTFFQKTPTQALGISTLFLYSFLVTFFICFLIGAWFVSAYKFFSFEEKSVPLAGKSYAFEAMGSITGGIITSFFLIKGNTFRAVFFLSFVIFFCLLFFFKKIRQKVFTIAGIVLLAFLFLKSEKINNFLLSFQWKPFELIESKNSIYANISVVKMGEDFNFYENGSLFFSTSFSQYSEEIVNFALLSHKNPKDILIIGGGLENPKQALKHPVKKIVFVALDPVLIETAKKYFKDKKIFSDRRLEIVYGDGRFFVKKTDKKFDVVIVDMPNPETALVNRFYTFEFFKEAKRVLKKDGVFEIALDLSENYMNEEIKFLCGSVFKTLKKVFANCQVVAGLRGYFLANLKEIDEELLTERLKERKVKLTYLTPYYIRYLLSKERVERVLRWIEEKKQVKINRDFSPVCYFYGILFWGSQFANKIPLFLIKLADLNVLWVFVFLGGFSGIFLFFLKKFKMKKIAVAGIVFATAFAGILAEILVIFSFQVLFGYLYYRIGLLMTLSMAGISAGSILSSRFSLKNRPKSLLKIFEFLFLFFLLLLPFLVKIRIAFIFPILTFLSGFFIGFVFPLGVCLYPETFKAESVSHLYGADVLGASFGSFLGSVFFIPVFGIELSCFLGAFFALFAVICALTL